VDPEICPNLRDEFELRATGDPDPKIIVHGEIERWIERAYDLPEVAAEERCLLGYVNIPLPQATVVSLCSWKTADDAILFAT
jgi:hypothetical protein